MRRARRATALAAVVMMAVTLTACGALPWGGGEDVDSSDAMIVEVQVTSDAATVGHLQVEVDARNDPQRVDQTDTPLPYTQTFEVPLDTPFPLSGTSVEATMAREAAWIECRIILDGKVVSEDRADGTGGIAVCEKKLRLGPQ